MDPDQTLVLAMETRIAEEEFGPEGKAVVQEFADTSEWMKRTYQKLHKIAASQMRHERVSHTLSATSLVHEVFLRLRNREASVWLNERQFLAIVTSEMRRVLIDAARRKNSTKRGGDHAQRTLDGIDVPNQLADSIVELNEAVDAFEDIEPEKAELVRLRYFLGLSESEAAQTLGISRATASRHWAFARAWLLDYLSN